MPAPSLQRRLVLVFSVLAVLLAGSLLFLARDTANRWAFPRMGSPAVTATEPRTQRVSETSALRIAFAETMDRKSAEEHLVLPEGLSGTTEWEGNVLVFHPAAPLTLGTTHVVTVSAGAKRAMGAPLLEDVKFTFIVAGPPAVTARFPTPDAKEVDEQEASIVITFDRAMVPLTLVGGQGSARPSFAGTIEPKQPGRWRWLGTTTVEFVPEGGLIPATAYTVHVPAGIPSAAGDATSQDYTWTFQTRIPALIETEPAAGDSTVGPQQEIRLSFNQEIDLASVGNQTHLAVEGKPVQLTPARYGKITNGDVTTEDRTVAVMKPATPLPLDSAVRLSVDAGIKGTRGALTSFTGSVIEARTAGPLTVIFSKFEYGVLTLSFSSPLPEGSLKKFITISPKPEGWDDVTAEPDSWSENMSVQLAGQFAPSTEYTVTLSADLTDVFGQKLGTEAVSTFTTPQLPPQVSIHSRGMYGIFERSKPPIYYIDTVNAGKLDMQLAKLTLKQFLSMRTAMQNDWSAEPVLPDAQQWSIPLGAKKNEWTKTPVDIAKRLGGKVEPGIYALKVTSPDYREEWNNNRIVPQYQFFSVTDLAIALKYSGNQALVWVTNTQTGEAVPGAVVQFHAINGTTVMEKIADAQGFVETDIELSKFANGNGYYWQPEFWVTAESDGDRTFVGSDWEDGIRPYDFGFGDAFRGGGASTYDLYSYMYTDRPIYRAGDTVHFKGIVRLNDARGKMILPPAGGLIEVTINDPEGTQVYAQELRVSQDGAFSGEFSPDEAAKLGDYYMNAMPLPDMEVGGQSAFATFRVLAYRKPEYKVSVSFAEEEYHDRDTVKADIEGAYYFGAPMDGANVEWRAQSADYYFNKYTGSDWYAFSEESDWCWYNCETNNGILATGKGKLDGRGHMTVSFPADLKEKAVSQMITVEADVTDPNNQTVSNRTAVIVHKSDVYVGVKPEEWVAAPGKEARFNVIALTPAGEPSPGRTVALTLYARDWNTVRTKGVDGEYYYENNHKDTKIGSTSVRTDGNGKATGAFVIPNGGSFVVKAETSDDDGRTAVSSTSVYAWSSSLVHWPATNNDRVEVIADKKQYAVGDTATLLVQSPYQGPGVRALVTVEREGVMQKHVVDVPSTALKLTIPVTEDFVPNAFVSVVIVKPRMGEAYDEQGKDTGLPAFKVGYAQINVDTSGRRLKIGVKTDKERYLPGETVAVTITTSDAGGKGVPADVSLSAVDASVLALAGFKPNDPLESFFGLRGLGVHTVHTLFHMLERFKPGSKGGGGGLEDAAVRGNFLDTAYWNPSIKTDGTGTARITFALPDNLTTWHFLAVGHTKSNMFGLAEDDVISTKNVLVRPMRPRFAVRGDHIQLGAIVHNESATDGAFTVTLSGSGFTATWKSSQTVKISAGALSTVYFPVTIGEVSRATLRFKAEGEGALDIVEESIPVEMFGSPQSVATNGVVDGVAFETIMLPPADAAVGTTLDVTITPTIAGYLPKGLEYLVKFPYGCAEQTTSSFLPNVMLSRLAKYGSFATLNEKDLQANVDGGLTRLYAFQRPDGGFGFWEGSPQSDVYLSTYVLWALQQTKAAGHAVDAGVMDRATNFLRSALRTQDPTRPLDAATRSFILFTLAEGGKADQGLMSNLYDRRETLPLFGKAYLAMAYQKVAGASTSQKAQSLLREILDVVKIESRGAHFEESSERAYAALMHTNTRTTAIVLQAMLRIDPNNPLASDIVRYLLTVRRDGHWDTTQSTSQSLLALVEYLESTGEMKDPVTGRVSFDGKRLLEESFKAGEVNKVSTTLTADELPEGREAELRLTADGGGRLYYDALLTTFWKQDVLPPAEEGMGVLREMEPVIPGQGLTAGSVHRVRLTITVPEDRHFVAVESPLAAGFEPIDLSLATSQQVALEDEANHIDGNDWMNYWENGIWRFSHIEYRDDRVFLFAEELPAGVYRYEYLVRAALPGTYRQRPARAWEMYYPEVYGQTMGDWIEVRE